jgi:hypothetical protein
VLTLPEREVPDTVVTPDARVGFRLYWNSTVVASSFGFTTPFKVALALVPTPVASVVVTEGERASSEVNTYEILKVVDAPGPIESTFTATPIWESLGDRAVVD